MPDKFCPQCGEKVDEAKAFCPACGNSFVVEEKRTDTSAYERADHTMQMGQTMYNNMLSDMGLNIKKAEPEKRIEVLKPVAVQPAEVLQPVASTQPATQTTTPEPAKDDGGKFWIVTLVIAILLLLGLLAAIVGVGVYLYFRAGRV